MIIVMRLDSTKEQLDRVIDKLEVEKISYNIEKIGPRMLIYLATSKENLEDKFYANYPGVESIAIDWSNLPLIGRKSKEEFRITIDKFDFNKDYPFIIAGPCAVESSDQLEEIASQIKNNITYLRGGSFKPRTSPYSFQGLEKEALIYLKRVKDKLNIPVVTEVLACSQIDLAYQYIDMYQVGARNMQNFELLKELGKQDKPVLLKRGFAATIDEWLNAAEYIATRGNKNIILCERGIRTFSKDTRNTLDLSSIPIIKSRTALPIIVDPSHATGSWHLVEPMALAAIAAGADGLMIEVHNAPDKALSDGDQSLKISRFNELTYKIKELAQLIKTF